MVILEKGFVMEKCPTRMCHASTVLWGKDGEMLFSWFGGSGEGKTDVGIWMCRRRTDGNFVMPEKMAESDEAHWNPVLFSTDEGKIILFFKVGNQISQWRTYIRISDDGGRSFGKQEELVPGDRGGRGPVKNKPIILQNGRVLAPGSAEGKQWTAFVDISDDKCKSFRKSSSISLTCGGESRRSIEYDRIPVSEQSFRGRGVIQPSLWEEGNGKVHMLLRSSEGYLYRSDSVDWGDNWTEAYPTAVPNNNSGMDLVKLSDRRILLVHNPVGENWGARSPLSVSISEDEGNTFYRLLDLEEKEGEFSYPSVIARGRDVWITYTYNRQNIAFCHMYI